MPQNEPDIIINGYSLSEAQAMAVRVAVSSMRIGLTDPEYREGLGESLADGYDRHLARVEQIMLKGL